MMETFYQILALGFFVGLPLWLIALWLEHIYRLMKENQS